MRIKIPLTAGVPARQGFKGSCVVLAELGAAVSVDFTLFGVDWQDADKFGTVERLFGVYDPARTFTGVELVATVDCVVDLIVSRSRVEVMDGATVTATIDAAQLPLPVSNDRGGAPGTPVYVSADRGAAPGTPVYVSGITYTDTPAATITDDAAVPVTSAGAVVLAAAATRLEARFANIGNDPVALGAPGITWAKRCIVLQPGDTWVEQKGAALAWSAITDTGMTASVTVQELKS